MTTTVWWTVLLLLMVAAAYLGDRLQRWLDVRFPRPRREHGPFDRWLDRGGWKLVLAMFGVAGIWLITSVYPGAGRFLFWASIGGFVFLVIDEIITRLRNIEERLKDVEDLDR